MAKDNSGMFFINDIDKIDNFISQISNSMHEYIVSKNKSQFGLCYKYITHSDLINCGKQNEPNKFDDNLLYYQTSKNMALIQKKLNGKLPRARQSNISLSDGVYKFLGIDEPEGNSKYLINDSCDVYLFNENLQYFSSKYTKQIFNKLNKKFTSTRRKNEWDFNNLDINLSNDKFTPINIHVAAHGIGTEIDQDFKKLRHHIFKRDTLILLTENDPNKERMNLFILLEKNPAFYSILGIYNDDYKKYQLETRERIIKQTNKKKKQNKISDDEINKQVTRNQQYAWRKQLANEMMAESGEKDIVFCPFTYIRANFKNTSPLFIASHIKGFKDPKTKDEEKYDINNGLLLSANADALFDKHYISINKDRELVFSFLIKNDGMLKQKLLLNQPIYTGILNDKRMKYLEYHYNVFLEKEKERKSKDIEDLNIEDFDFKEDFQLEIE